jgi:hypothetical protein
MGVAIRGDDGICGSLISYIDLEKRVRADHPLRVIRQNANAALKALSGEFAQLYSPIGRESIPPERLMRTLLLQAFYSIRSERQLVADRLRFVVSLVYRARHRGRGVGCHELQQEPRPAVGGRGCGQFLAGVLSQDKVKPLLSSERFSVDGTLPEAWASPKSFRPKDGSGEPPGPGRNGALDFHGERRRNDRHTSTTDPDARLFRKSLPRRKQGDPGKKRGCVSWATS